MNWNDTVATSIPLWALASIGGMLFFSWLAVGLMLRVCQKQRRKAKAALASRKANTLVDLELATSEQLMKEIRHRSENPFILLTPIRGEDHTGITIEAHSLDPETSVKVLHMAAMLTLKEFKSRGLDVGEVPKLFDGEED